MNTSLGYIIFAEEISTREQTAVEHAAREAGLPEDLLSEIKPRNLFIRAIRKLETTHAVDKESGADSALVHKFKDDKEKIEFQFSNCYLQEHGVKYEKQAVVSFDKESHLITCENEDVLRLAQELYAQVQGMYSASDIQAYIKRVVVKEKARRVLLRDGVYFLGTDRADLGKKIKKFLNKMGFTCFMLTASTSERADLIKATVRDVCGEISRLEREIITLKQIGEEEGGLTPRIAKNRLKELNQALSEYRELARSLGCDLKEILDGAGEAGKVLATVGLNSVDELLARVQRRDELLPCVVDLVCAAAEEPVPLGMPTLAPVLIGEEEEVEA